MTRSAVALRHVEFEDLGILAPLLAARGYTVRYLQSGIDPLTEAAAADLLIVLGGPIGVGDADDYPFLRDEIALLRGRIDEGRPTLGICLGAQLIAAALGAEVAPTGRSEIGYGPLTLTDEGRGGVLALLGDVPVLHWHGDEFAIPAGSATLAGTPGFPHQAFAVGSHVLALQFHLEADHTTLERWLIGHAHELAAHRIDLNALRADAARVGPVLSLRAADVFGAWLDGLD